MEGYFYGLLGACLFCGVCGLLSPEGSSQKYIRLLGGFFVLCVMLAPLPELLHSWNTETTVWGELEDHVSVSNYDEIYKNTLINAGTAELSSYLEQELIRRLSLEDSELSVQVGWEEGENGYELKKVWVILRGKAILQDPEPILSFVEKECYCACVIVYE